MSLASADLPSDPDRTAGVRPSFIGRGISWRYFRACAQRCFQRHTAERDRQVIRRADLLHHPFDEVVEDPEFAVEGFEELFIGLNPHHQLGKHTMPTDDINPASPVVKQPPQRPRMYARDLTAERE